MPNLWMPMRRGTHVQMKEHEVGLGVTSKRGLGFRLNGWVLTLVYTDLYQV